MKEIRVFIAGSKMLQVERDAIRASLMELSNKNIDKGVLIRTYTFEDFSRSFVDGGRQQEYNQFIAEMADYVIFVLDNTVGGITLSEFNLAMEAFMSKGRPSIFVYCNSANATNSFDEIISRINENHQYYIEYNDIASLKLQVKADFNEILAMSYNSLPSNNLDKSISLNEKAKYAVELGAKLHLFIFSAMVGYLDEQIEAFDGIAKSCNVFKITPPVSKPITIIPTNEAEPRIQKFLDSLDEYMPKEFVAIAKIAHYISLITTFGVYDPNGSNAAINKIRQDMYDQCMKYYLYANLDKSIIESILDASQNKKLLGTLVEYYNSYDQKIELCECGNRHIKGNHCHYCGKK